MPTYPWFKFWSEARTDPKLESLADDEFRVWSRLLCFANDQPTRGTIAVTGKRLLAVHVARGDVALLDRTLAALRELEIIDGGDDTLRFIHWEKRQAEGPRPPSAAPERVAQRVAAHRERERSRAVDGKNETGVTTCNDPVTRGNESVTRGNDPRYRVVDTDVEGYPIRDITERERESRASAGEADGQASGALASDRSQLLRSGPQQRSQADARDASPSASPSERESGDEDPRADARARMSLLAQVKTDSGLRCSIAAIEKSLAPYPELLGRPLTLLTEALACGEYNVVTMGKEFPTLADWQRWLARRAEHETVDRQIAQGLCVGCGAEREPGQRKYCIGCEAARAEARQRGNGYDDDQTTWDVLASSPTDDVVVPHEADAKGLLRAADLSDDQHSVSSIRPLMGELMSSSYHFTVDDLTNAARKWSRHGGVGGFLGLSEFLRQPLMSDTSDRRHAAQTGGAPDAASR